MKALDAVRFLMQYIRNPRSIGAVCPSSRFLAAKMANGANGRSGGGVIVELGAGTGAVTRALVSPEFLGGRTLYSIEFNPELCEALRRNFPNVNIINGSAEDIRKLLGDDARKIEAVVSSLPLLSLPDFMVGNIVREVEESLPVGGRFVQFTYQLNRKPEKIGFKTMSHIKRCFVFLNIPPARVDVFEKR